MRATPHPPLQWFTGRFCKRADVPKGTCCAAWASAPTEGADHPHQRVFRQPGHFLEERAGRLDDFHLLTDGRAAGFLCTLANRLPGNVHLIVASRDRFLPAAETVRLGARVCQIGTEQLRLNHTELSVYARRCGSGSPGS